MGWESSLIAITGMELEALEEVISIIKTGGNFDFGGYARQSLRRRILHFVSQQNLTLPEFVEKLKLGQVNIGHLVQSVTVNYTEMFRDPDFFKFLRKDLFVYLNSFPFIRVWSAGCASGEETFSLLIILRELDLESKSFTYATDVSMKVIKQARDGMLPLSKLKTYSENYMLSEGTSSLSDYYEVMYEQAYIRNEIRKKALFAIHNLNGDGVFNEFNLILCRNVMIYFTNEQRVLVLKKLYDSLMIFGFLCLGKRESLHDTGLESYFKIYNKELNIFQKVK